MVELACVLCRDERVLQAEHHLREAMRIEPTDRRVKRTLATLLSVHLEKKEEADALLETIKEPLRSAVMPPLYLI